MRPQSNGLDVLSILFIMGLAVTLSSFMIDYNNSRFRAKYDARIKTITVPLEQETFQRVANLSYGMPPQSLKTIFITRYTESKVLTPSYASAKRLDHNRGYKNYLSDTAIESSKPVNGGTDNGGSYVQDSLILGPGIVVENQTLAQVSEIKEGEEDIIIGLGLRRWGDSGNLLENLVKQKLINEPVFSYYLSRDASKSGSIHFGRPNERHYRGDLVYTDLERTWPFDPRVWFIRNEGFRALGVAPRPTEVCSEGCSMYVDPNSVLILGPRQEGAKLNQALGAELETIVDSADIDIYRYPSCKEAYDLEAHITSDLLSRKSYPQSATIFRGR